MFVRLMLTLVALVCVLRADPLSNAGAALPPPPPAAKRIALTFDDVPRNAGAFMTQDERTDRLIATFKEFGVRQVAFFVNPGRIVPGDEHEARIDRYVAAGHLIADHTATHPHLGGVSADAFLADIDTAEAWLKGRPGYRPWFRFPFLDEGGANKAKRDAVRAGLRARGLMNGYVTVDGSDWNMEQLTLEARKAGKPIDMAALRDLYVETHVQSADFSDALAVKTLGRSPAHVLLLHETDLAGLFIGDLIKALRADGWEIISPEEAYADPIHTAEPDTPYAAGTLAEQLAWEKGIKGARWYDRNETRVADPLFFDRVLHGERVAIRRAH